jgi:hypothetical protein
MALPGLVAFMNKAAAPPGGGSGLAVAGTTSGFEEEGSLTPSIPLSGTASSGDLLLVTILYDNNTADFSGTPPSGWVLEAHQANSIVGLIVLSKVAAGGETAVTVTFTGTMFSMGYTTYRITGAHGDVDVAVNGSSTDPPNLSPAWGSAATLWLAVVALLGEGSITANPTSYTDALTGAGHSDVVVIRSLRRLLTASSENPATFSYSGGELFDRVSATIAIRPS